jgi:hypothetical protein
MKRPLALTARSQAVTARSATPFGGPALPSSSRLHSGLVARRRARDPSQSLFRKRRLCTCGRREDTREAPRNGFIDERKQVTPLHVEPVAHAAPGMLRTKGRL